MNDEDYKITREDEDLFTIPKTDPYFKTWPSIPRSVLDQLIQQKIITMPPYWVDEIPFKKKRFYRYFNERLRYVIERRNKGLPIDDDT